MEISSVPPHVSPRDANEQSLAQTQQKPRSSPDVRTTVSELARQADAGTLQQGQSDVRRSPVASAWNVGTAAIEGVLRFLQSVTTIYSPPPTRRTEPQPIQRPQPTPQPDPTPKPEPTPQAPVAPSLIPSWARMFESTGNSKWHPGGASQNGYIDLRSELKGKIESIEILSADGTKVLATGKFEKITADGKPRFRFNIKGSQLPEGAIIKATLKPNDQGQHGGIRYIEIPKPGQAFAW